MTDGPTADGLAKGARGSVQRRRVLVVGHFSFHRNTTMTAGDALAAQELGSWLDRAGWEWDLAAHPPFVGDVTWKEVDPSSYTHLVFVCGPIAKDYLPPEFWRRFGHCVSIAIDVSPVGPPDELGFDVVLERDGRTTRPDLALASPREAMPLVGVFLVHPQYEYGERGVHDEVHDLISKAVDRMDVTAIPLDTALIDNPLGTSDLRKIDAMFPHLDAVISTRMHGVVLALKHGVPVLAIDPIRGGAKVSAQARVLGWTHLISGEEATIESITEGLERVLDPSAAGEAQRSRTIGLEQLGVLEAELVSILSSMDIAPEPRPSRSEQPSANRHRAHLIRRVVRRLRAIRPGNRPVKPSDDVQISILRR